MKTHEPRTRAERVYDTVCECSPGGSELNRTQHSLDAFPDSKIYHDEINALKSPSRLG
jgi:hypothetical protein